MTNALGQTGQVTSHLPGGLPQTVVDTNGVTTNVTYDARLRLATMTITTGAGPIPTSYTYDAAGNATALTLPDGSAVNITYDVAHRLTGITDLLQQNVAYTLDAMGNRTQASVLAASGSTQMKHSASFDALGRLAQDIGGAGQTMRYSYDSNGNALSIADGLTHTTQRSFDALNRLTRVTNAAGRLATLAYDSLDHPTSLTDANGAATKAVYDGFGDVIQQVSPDSGTSVYHYDQDGNLTQRVDGAGAITNYAYDALERPIAATYPADPAENVTYTYDEAGHGFGVGRLTTMTDAAGQLSRSYDEQGNLLNETRSDGAVTLSTSYSYDAAARMVSITYPSGWTALYSRDSMGRVTGIGAQTPDGSVTLPIASGIAYLPFGPMTALPAANGVTETRGFDTDYRLLTLAAKGNSALQNLSYSYDAADNVLSTADGSPTTQKFSYDTVNRLTTAAGSYGSFTFSYDAVGNRTAQMLGTTTTTYSYASATNRLTKTVSGATSQTIGYTAAGNINAITPSSGAATAVTYNQAGRLESITSGTQPVAQYVYDGFGQRVAKSNLFRQYDHGGHLIEETDNQGNAQADYIYLDDRPVAVLEPSGGSLYWIHTDRMDTPQIATDRSQAIAWSAAYQPFGQTSAPSNVIPQNLRMPGQELDSETGWYHNGFRDYMPGLGRYLEADLLGLAGGLNVEAARGFGGLDANLYAYAGNNPLHFVDPLGLYYFEWKLGPATPSITPERAMWTLWKNPNQFFPFNVVPIDGGNGEINMGARFRVTSPRLVPLGLGKTQWEGWNLTVSNVSPATRVSPPSFTFFTDVDTPGAPTGPGPGATVTFTIFQRGDSLWLSQTGLDVSGHDPWITEVLGAWPAWRIQSENLKKYFYGGCSPGLINWLATDAQSSALFQ